MPEAGEGGKSEESEDVADSAPVEPCALWELIEEASRITRTLPGLAIRRSATVSYACAVAVKSLAAHAARQFGANTPKACRA